MKPLLHHHHHPKNNQTFILITRKTSVQSIIYVLGKCFIISISSKSPRSLVIFDHFITPHHSPLKNNDLFALNIGTCNTYITGRNILLHYLLHVSDTYPFYCFVLVQISSFNGDYAAPKSVMSSS